MVFPEGFDVDARPWWPTDNYMRWRGQWLAFNHRGDDLWVFSPNTAPVPEGFTEIRAMPGRANGSLKIPLAEAGPVVRVHTVVLWKNVLWDVLGFHPDRSVLSLNRMMGLPSDYVDGRPYPPERLFVEWPGVKWEDRDLMSVWVVPGELAGVRVDVTPVVGSRVVREERLSWWRESLVSSPFLPGDRAVELVREFVVEEGMSVGSYPMDALQVVRLRDGWRVWGQPPEVEGVEDLRLGWAVFYVGDDGVVVRTSTSVPFGEAAQGLSNEVYQRALLGPRIASSGPVGIGVGPVLKE